MDGSFLPSKRGNEREHSEANGRKKFRSSGSTRSAPPPLRVGPDETIFRVLCVAPKIGGVIGKEGSIIKQIRTETGAKIRIEEGVPGCEERVIVIVAPISEKKKGKTDDAAVDGATENEEKAADGKSGVKDEAEDGKSNEKEGDNAKQTSIAPAQEALLRVLDRILEGETDIKAEEEGVKGPTIVSRLLVPTSQVGCVLGKGGKIIQEIRTETGTQIRILSREQVPACALPSDEVVQIMGEVSAVKKALLAVSERLLKNPPREQDQIIGGRHGPYTGISPSIPPADGFPSRKNPSLGGSFPSVDYHPKAPPVPLMREAPPSARPPIQEEIQFRLLCTNDKVGAIIGKAGAIIKGLQRDTGADIKIADAVSDEDERVVVITGSLVPESRLSPLSPAQNALLRVYNRIANPFPDKPEKNKAGSARLLVPANQVGCLLGKGGSIIADMRRQTRTDIRIFNKDNCPKCASPNDELVQVTGDNEGVQDALIQITTRLMNNLYPEKPLPAAGASAFTDPLHPVATSLPPYRGRPEPASPPRLYPHLRAAPLQDIEPAGRLSHVDRPSYPHSLNRPVEMSHKIEKPVTSPRPWPMQGAGITGASGRSLPDYGRGFPSRSGLPSGSQSAVVTNTTVEVHVPLHVVGSIYGDNGDNLDKLRQISGAKVTMHDPLPGMSEVMVLISGTPEQTKAAQSLLQAFIMSGQSSSP